MEVNVWRAATTIFNGEKLTQQDFRRKFAKELIFNDYDAPAIENVPTLHPRINIHNFISIQRYHKIDIKTGEQVSTKTEWLMWKCKVCKKCKKATYCACDPTINICRDCHMIHVLEAFSLAQS